VKPLLNGVGRGSCDQIDHLKAHVNPAVVSGIAGRDNGIHRIFNEPGDCVLNLIKLNRWPDGAHLNQPNRVEVFFGKLFEQVDGNLHVVAGTVVAQHDRLDHNWFTLRS